MKDIALKAWKFGLTIFDENDKKVMSVNEITDNGTYHYIVEESMFEELKNHFLVFLRKINYKPMEIDLENMATQIASHYAVCIENEPEKSYINTITSFNSIKESVEWFWKQIMEELKGYDAQI